MARRRVGHATVPDPLAGVTLTPRQQEVYDLGVATANAAGVLPRPDDLAYLLRCTRHAVGTVLRRLTEKGVLTVGWPTRNAAGRQAALVRTLVPVSQIGWARALPILGAITGGTVRGCLPPHATAVVPEDLLGAREHYVLTVDDDTLADVDVRSGDRLVCEHRTTPRDGDTYLATTTDGRLVLDQAVEDGGDTAVVTIHGRVTALLRDDGEPSPTDWARQQETGRGRGHLRSPL